MKKGNIIAQKKVVIIGLSRSGEAAALLARRHAARVFVSEQAKNKPFAQKASYLRKKGITVELGAHRASFLKNADFLITSPGVKNSAFPIRWAKRNKVQIFSEIEFASWFCKRPIIAITGSNGKTTVTALLGALFKNAGWRTVVCGNIGNPFSGEISRIQTADVVILEVSSFQLQHTRWLRPRVSIILNISPNHFDYHRTMQEYVRAKAKIVSNQRAGDFTILNFGDRRLINMRKKTKARVLFFSSKKDNILSRKDYCYGACWQDGGFCRGQWRGKRRVFFDTRGLRLQGEHNVENAMAAALAAKTAGIKQKTLARTLKIFKGLAHRTEIVASRDGVCFINDSKSTTVDATKRALAMFGNHSVILICGGRDKGGNFAALRSLIEKKVFLLVLIGEAKDKIRNALCRKVPAREARTLEQAVRIAYEHRQQGTTILLSPMCSSFDMFENFEQRGIIFKRAVRRLFVRRRLSRTP